jgi:hypothetical protein
VKSGLQTFAREVASSDVNGEFGKKQAKKKKKKKKKKTFSLF